MEFLGASWRIGTTEEFFISLASQLVVLALLYGTYSIFYRFFKWTHKKRSLFVFLPILLLSGFLGRALTKLVEQHMSI